MFKYLVANDRDVSWGLHVDTIGYEEIQPGEHYPTQGHADGFYFDVKRGRRLDEYQLQYIKEGSGIFRSTHQPETRLHAGDVFLLFPGEWHTYCPDPEKGWKCYWIGFKGHNMDERIKANFLSSTKPIYHIGFSEEFIHVFDKAIEIAEAEAEGTTLSTPAGKPASSIVCAKYWDVSGVRRAGLRTMVHPAAIAAPALRVAIANGKFHGVISRHGPTGLRATKTRFLPSGVGWYRP